MGRVEIGKLWLGRERERERERRRRRRRRKKNNWEVMMNHMYHQMYGR
jgi:hypothetical protein